MSQDLDEMEERIRAMFLKLWAEARSYRYDEREWENFLEGLHRYFQEVRGKFRNSKSEIRNE